MSAHDVSERLRAPAGAAQPAGGVPGRDRFRRARGLPVPAGELSPDPAMFCLAPAAMPINSGIPVGDRREFYLALRHITRHFPPAAAVTRRFLGARALQLY
jgi:hypothetical protein